MFLKGKKLQEPNRVDIFIPRGDDEPIVLTAQAILDMSEFDSLCPPPKAPIIMFRGGEKRQDLEDPRYIKELNNYGEMRSAYMVIKSLEATEELQWEIVSIKNPETWLKYSNELRESGFSDVEVQRIILGVMEANALSESKIEKARASFLAGRDQVVDSSSHSSARNGTPSGEPVSA